MSSHNDDSTSIFSLSTPNTNSITTIKAQLATINTKLLTSIVSIETSTTSINPIELVQIVTQLQIHCDAIKEQEFMLKSREIKVLQHELQQSQQQSSQQSSQQLVPINNTNSHINYDPLSLHLLPTTTATTKPATTTPATTTRTTTTAFLPPPSIQESNNELLLAIVQDYQAMKYLIQQYTIEQQVCSDQVHKSNELNVCLQDLLEKVPSNFIESDILDRLEDLEDQVYNYLSEIPMEVLLRKK